MRERHTLIFDGECGICGRSVAWVEARDGNGEIECIPYQSPSVPQRFPQISLEEMQSAMQLVAPDGTRWEGARAVEELLTLLPRWRVVAALFRVPGARVLARMGYRLVARNRRQLGCGTHCSVDGNRSNLSS